MNELIKAMERLTAWNAFAIAVIDGNRFEDMGPAYCHQVPVDDAIANGARYMARYAR